MNLWLIPNSFIFSGVLLSSVLKVNHKCTWDYLLLWSFNTAKYLTFLCASLSKNIVLNY